MRTRDLLPGSTLHIPQPAVYSSECFLYIPTLSGQGCASLCPNTRCGLVCGKKPSLRAVEGFDEVSSVLQTV